VTLAHWTYLLGALVIVITMMTRKNIVVPSLVFTFVVAWTYKASIVFSIQTIFNANLYAATQLFNVFLIISIMVAMLQAAHYVGADLYMIRPIQRLMRSPWIAYLVLVVATFTISLFFWPTPAIPLVGALLIPAAVRAGLSPMAAAVAVALAGQGMALAGDFVIQGAPSITAGAAGVPLSAVLLKGGVLTGITGVIAIPLAYLLHRREVREFHRLPLGERTRMAGMLASGGVETVAPDESRKDRGRVDGRGTAIDSETAFDPADTYGSSHPRWRLRAIVLACLIPLALVGVIVALFAFRLKGGEATALLGGMGTLLLIIVSLSAGGRRLSGFERVSDHLVDGFTFAFRAMGPVVPIAGFFYLGSPDGAGAILGKGAPGFLFDAAIHISHVLPPGSALAAFGVLVLGLLTGLDGSGFAGLPLVGAVAGALGHGDVQTVSMLGAIGQMGSVWSGGGTIVTWSSLIAVAAIAGVDATELAKRNLLPVIVGLVVSTIATLFIW
jgi:hypothetical protein